MRSDPQPQGERRPPESGWELGASGLGRPAWAVLAILVLALAVILLVTGYVGYSAMILVLAIAAAVNLF